MPGLPPIRVPHLHDGLIVVKVGYSCEARTVPPHHHTYCAQAIPSASLPASIRRSTFHCATSITATWLSKLQATYAFFPSPLTSTSDGPPGTSIGLTTFMVFRSTTATCFAVRSATSNHRPSGVGAVP